MNITGNTRVGEIASAVPSSVRVFQRHGIDFCCGGKVPLARACEQRGVSVEAVVGEVLASARGAADEPRDWTHEPLHALVDHIVATYHDPLRDELPRLEAMAGKVARVHETSGPHVGRVAEIVAELGSDLWAHMQKEERMLFPQSKASRRNRLVCRCRSPLRSP